MDKPKNELAGEVVHDYESPRDAPNPTEPCAICGQARRALIHQTRR